MPKEVQSEKSTRSVLAATREILAAISTHQGDEKTVFGVVLEKACSLCNASLAGLTLVDEKREYIDFIAEWGESSKIWKVGETKWPLDSPVVISRSVVEKRTLHVPDLEDDDLYRARDPIRVRVVEEDGLKTFLSVPLIKDDEAIGGISVYRRFKKAFSKDEIALVETFAAQVVVAIESVRQFRELQARLEREHATAEILSVISQSRDDEQPVFDIITEKAAKLCVAASASLLLADEAADQMSFLSDYRGDASVVDHFKRQPISLDAEKYELVKSMRDQKVISYDDLADSHLYRMGEPHRKFAVDEEGIGSIFFVPLIQDGIGIGTIALFRREVRPFSDQHIRLIQTFAAQAVIAIENVRKNRAIRERFEREAATRDILEVISRSRDDNQPVFEVILQNAARLSGAICAVLLLGRPEDSEMRLTAFEHTAPDQNLATEAIFNDMQSAHFPMDPEAHNAAQAICSGDVVQVEDLMADPRYLDGAPSHVAAIDGLGARTVLSVPLCDNKGALGAINLYRTEQRAFARDEIALVETFAAQAVIAIENVRQFRELQDRLKREQATSEVLGVINRSRDNENPVFQSILSSASRLCDAPLALFAMVDAERGSVVLNASIGASPEYIAAMNEHGVPLDDQRHAAARAVATGEPVHVLDAADSDLYAEGAPGRTHSVDIEGIRTFVAVPVMAGDDCLGIISLFRRVVRAFDDDQVTLLKSFAAQAAIAIENVRQFREVQERLKRETATGEVLEVINISRDDDAPIFATILERACSLCNASFAFLNLVDRTKGTIHCVGTHGSSTAFSEAARDFEAPLDTALLVGASIREKKVIAISDLREEQRVAPVNLSERTRSIEEEGIRSVLYVPLIRNDEGMGCIAIYRQEVRPFKLDEIKLIETFASQATIAIENVRQFKALETLNAELGERVDEQVGEIERMGRLKRFLPSAVADAIVTSGDESMLTSHRALVATLFCDMRGFTAFCESAEPEETIEVLQTYHQEMSELIDQYGGGVDQRAGDGIMVIFNDPIPVDDPAGDAVRLAIAMREKMKELCGNWKRLGYRLGFGVGISLGYATVGMVGSAGRFDYTASGTSVNTAARLCDMALDGEILIAPRVWIAVEDHVEAESRGEVEMKGIREPVEVFSVS